ncbi:tRNA pseudouridine(55) synthase TruB [Stieleria sp. TO1_6]|uniref:tRNA pseudouridine(55) synthase TruB n=1 Tax=Stieleria tagensis TaxID=2956795 RepID=UPI00209A8784|nr:tRNA pseudouridine(55) synthase TruB [Stieleria tagensis]MCO8124517.1 tRNA pseudouridine(55) synthase TruB [Stieleria tagensis]
MFGFLNCHKPIGFSSRDVVNVIQGQLRGQRVKIGHCGTLDPLADGVLLVGVGPAAKLVPYVHEADKCYRGNFRLAAESPTGDMEFEPTVYSDHPIPTTEQLAAACQTLIGSIEQVPPAYSAIKVDGKRAYRMARQGQTVEMPARQVQIDSIKVLEYQYPDLSLEIVCGTGTYIRTLGMDLAQAVGTVAVMTALTRTRVGEFELADSITIDQIRENEIESMLMPAALGVSHMTSLSVDAEECVRLTNGLGLSPSRQPTPGPDPQPLEIAALTPQGNLKAILVQKNGCWYPKRVFPDAGGNPASSINQT